MQEEEENGDFCTFSIVVQLWLWYKSKYSRLHKGGDRLIEGIVKSKILKSRVAFIIIINLEGRIEISSRNSMPDVKLAEEEAWGGWTEEWTEDKELV